MLAAATLCVPLLTVFAGPSERVQVGLGVEGELAPALPVAVGPVQIAVPSLAVTVEFSRWWAMQLLAGGAWASSRTDGPIEAQTRQVGFHSSLRGLLWPLRWDRARVGVVLQAGYRGVFERQVAEQQPQTVRRHGMVAATGLRPEFFLLPQLSLHTQLGLAYAFEHRGGTQTTQSFRFAGEVLAQTGLTIWF